MPELVLPYPPSANRYWRLCKGKLVVSSEAQAFKRMAWVLSRQGERIEKLAGNVSLAIELHPKKGTGACIDLDNALKISLDALQGIVYENDKQVVQIAARRMAPVPGGRLVVKWQDDESVADGK